MNKQEHITATHDYVSVSRLFDAVCRLVVCICRRGQEGAALVQGGGRGSCAAVGALRVVAVSMRADRFGVGTPIISGGMVVIFRSSFLL